MPDHQPAPLETAEFNEAEYLRRYPDVVDAIANGRYRSGREHFELYGRAEGRVHHSTLPPPPARVTFGPVDGFRPGPPGPPRHSVEELLIAEDGWILMIGWAADHAAPLSAVRVDGHDWSARLESDAIARVPRADVLKALDLTEIFPAGFVMLIEAGARLRPLQECRVSLEWGPQQAVNNAPVRIVGLQEMLARLLTLLGHVASGGDGIAAMLALNNDLGAQITALNRTVTAGLTARPFIQRFGPEGPAPKGSIVVCLHGRAEYQFTQNALYANRPGIEDYEFIYVCNSPELLELVLKNATCGTTIYGLRQTVIGLPGNAGFGAANNVGVAAARSDRILCVNPDVFPRDPDWAARHTALVAQGGDGSRLFGAMLFYDDGSLMHGGMYFEVDTGLAIRGGRVQSAPLARVEHFGKGAPPDTAPFLRPRPVAAVSGAFISIERALYERLGGFSPEFVLGHYEDADLCLRAMQLGVVPWVQDVKMWHLEGQGSRRNMLLPGANLVNRWLFSRRWSALIRARLTGPDAEPCSLAAEPTAEAA